MAFSTSNTSFVWLDIETGGPDISKYPIIQVAFVATGPMTEFETLEQFEVKLQFNEAECDPEALKKNSYDPEVWAKEAVPPSEAIAKIKDFLERHCSRKMISRNGNTYYIAKGAGHNVASFDVPALHKLFREHGEFCSVSYQTLDTLHFMVSMSWLMGVDLTSYSLDTLAELYGVDPGGHDALADVHANIEIFRKFLLEGLPDNTGN